MLIILKKNADLVNCTRVSNQLKNHGFTGKITSTKVGSNYVIAVEGDTTLIDTECIGANPYVEKVFNDSVEYRLVENKGGNRTVINVGGISIGGDAFVMMAGPCSVESKEQLTTISTYLANNGCDILRGGAFKPRTSPYSFQGLGEDGLELLCQAKHETGMPVISEIVSPSDIPLFGGIDIFQVGARNMQNFALLKELGNQRKPVLLKRGMGNSVDDLLLSAEYIMKGGNEQVILCERGVTTVEGCSRSTLDISAIPMLKRKTHLPVIVDPSHAAGIDYMVEPLALAAVAAGADGIIVEVHNKPEEALSDGAQAITPQAWKHLYGMCLKIYDTVRKK